MRSLRLCLGLFVTFSMVLSCFASDKKNADQPFANLHFTVINDANGKPVRAASIVLHPVKKDGTQAKGGFQLKTDGEGVTETEGIPFGKLRIQVLAPGFQTFGDDYQINKADMDIQVRLKRPGEQLSVYGKQKDKQQEPPTAVQPAAPPATPPAEPKPN
jgi:hypothetical protein